MRHLQVHRVTGATSLDYAVFWAVVEQVAEFSDWTAWQCATRRTSVERNSFVGSDVERGQDESCVIPRLLNPSLSLCAVLPKMVDGSIAGGVVSAVAFSVSVGDVGCPASPLLCKAKQEHLRPSVRKRGTLKYAIVLEQRLFFRCVICDTREPPWILTMFYPRLSS